MRCFPSRLSAPLLLLFAVSAAANTVNVQLGSLHVYQGSTFDGWVDKGSNLGGTFKVIFDPSIIAPLSQNQGLFYYTDAGPGNPVKIYCNGCGVHQGTGEVVDLQLGTVIGQYEGSTEWLFQAVSERSRNEGIYRRDLSESFLWMVDSSGGAGADWPVTPIILDASGAQVSPLPNMLLGSSIHDCTPGSPSPTVNCAVWWGSYTADQKQGEEQDIVTLKFSRTSVNTVWVPPDDTSAALCV